MRILVCILWSCFTSFVVAQNHELAQNYFEKGDFEKAKISYEQLFQANPSNHLYLTRLVESYQQLRQYDTAIDVLKTYIKQTRQYEFLVLMGYTYQLQGELKKADKQYQEAIEQIEKVPGLVYSIGRAFEKKSLLDWALKSYETATQKNPNLNFNFQIALIYGEKGDFDQMINRLLSEAYKEPSRRQQIQHYLAQYFVDDIDGGFKEKLKKALLVQAQETQDIFWNQFLSWYFIQNKEYSKAFRQQKAIVKREPDLFSEIINLVYIAIEENEKEATQEIGTFILDQTIHDGLRLSLQYHLLSYELETLDPSKYLDFKNRIDTLLTTYKTNTERLDLILLAAHFNAFYLNQPEKSEALLQQTLNELPDPFAQAKIKMELAEVLTYQEQFNRALIYYSQVEMDFKNNPVGHDASFKIAQTSYYKGDFEWTLNQVKVLKSSTSQLIANDALEIFLLITDNNQADSTYTALKAFSQADLKLFQKKNKEALDAFEFILKTYPNDPIQEPTQIRLGDVYTQLNEYQKAITHYELLLTHFPESVYIDEALFYAAELYLKLENPTQAQTLFEKIIINHPDSIHYSKAQQRYRTLRGDKDF